MKVNEFSKVYREEDKQFAYLFSPYDCVRFQSVDNSKE